MIISENLARESWGSRLGCARQAIARCASKNWFEVVGVVEDVHVNGVQEKAPAIVYWPAMVDGDLRAPDI